MAHGVIWVEAKDVNFLCSCSQSDLDADDEDNASLHQSDSVNSLVQNVSRHSFATNGRPATENIEDVRIS